jgi:signal transduction histidine kinase
LVLTLGATEAEGWLYCTVKDNGVGIEPEQCQKLFDPYFRGGQQQKSIGLGLGLYLCRQVIEAHGGEIGVESQVGAGTTFWFTLPIANSTLSPRTDGREV